MRPRSAKLVANRGFQDVELNTAFEIALGQSDQTFTIVPVRLEDTERGDNRLSIYQQYDLFADWEGVLDNLAVLFGGSSLGVIPEETDERTEDQKIIAALEGKADAFYLSGYVEKALILLHTIEELGGGETFRSLVTRGAALHTLCKFEEAESAFDKAISLLPDDKSELSPEVAVVFTNKEKLLKDWQRFENAKTSYKESLPNPIKAVPVSSAELEQIQRDIRFNSPAPKHETAPPPTAGEVWKLHRTLPSGIVLLTGLTFSFMNGLKEKIRTRLLGERIDSGFDERPYLYDVERFKKEHPGHSIQLRNTSSVSWHPTLSLLATIGDLEYKRRSNYKKSCLAYVTW